jgi:catalase
MASRRQRAAEPRKNRKAAQPAKASARSTMSGPSAKRPRGSGDDEATRKFLGTGELAATRPFNRNKAGEHGQAAHVPETGEHYDAPGPEVTGSTLSESNRSPKTGGRPALGVNAAGGNLDRVRADSSGQVLTTNQGVPVGDNQNSLKAGLRGPALLEDFILREKVTHFDHERIPERIVHARGSAAHGFFECYKPLTRLTRASLFAEAGKRTPVFVRFSTVAGERGSTDTARDVRGFAVKFYTDEGNWDLVGNNIPIFFIQDAMKFPDLVHAVKPEPHHGMPQAASAHDTFWDFVSLMPESVHMQMWVMSDRAIPRSYRMMQGFGVHTFRMINARGDSVFVKFHWSPVQGTHSLDWDEAVKISGADPDFHRRDLWEAIEAGAHPEWELGVQVFTEEQAEKFSFDVLDATKLVPEELVRVEPVGRMVLNRNPDNFFAETEQAAFCAAHIVPGLDFTNDPLLAGRIHSYVDTQISRLGGPNFHEIPINAPIAAVHNNQRDGMHRQAVHRGRVAYEPNSLGGGCPFQAGAKGFVSFPQPVREDKVRGKPEKFADHYTQAALFYESQTPVEQAHIVRAFRFELTKVQVPAIRERVVSQLRNVNEDLARQVATGLGIDLPKPQPALRPVNSRAEVKRSPALSLMARPGKVGVATRRIALLIADGAETESLAAIHAALLDAGAVPRFVGPKLGAVADIDIEVTFEAAPSVLFDAVVVPDGSAAQILAGIGNAIEFVKDQYRHCKTILALGEGDRLLAAAGIPEKLADGGEDPGLMRARDGAEVVAQFIDAIARHRHLERYSDPPRV